MGVNVGIYLLFGRTLNEAFCAEKPNITRTYPEWATRHADSTIGDHDGVLDRLPGHVSAVVRAISVVLHQHVHVVVLSVNARHLKTVTCQA